LYSCFGVFLSSSVLNNLQLDAGALEELAYWRQNFTETKNWYYKEYEVLPLWFKRLGHIVKVFQGKRKFRSLFSNNVNHK